MGLFSKSKPKVSEKLKLTCMPGDAASYKCIFLAAYRKISIEFSWCEPSSLDDKMSESLKMSNLNTYPCIEDGDFTICGENAVLTYLNIKGRTPSIHPRKARVLAMQQYWSQVLNSKCTSEDDFKAVFELLDQALQGNKYIVGEFSLADINWLGAFKALEVSDKFVDLSQHKNISDWLSRMKSEIPEFEAKNEKVSA